MRLDFPGCELENKPELCSFSRGQSPDEETVHDLG